MVITTSKCNTHFCNYNKTKETFTYDDLLMNSPIQAFLEPEKSGWSGSLLFCSIVLKSMISYVSL